MKTPRRSAAALVVLGLLAATAGAGDDRPGTLVLFDGKSLEGWRKTDFFHAGEVKVDDGAIVIAAGGPMAGVTCTRQGLPTVDYELSYEARRLSGRDFFAAATFPVGKSFATLVNGGWGGSVTGISSLNGADASENDTSRYVKYQDRTWYRFRVRVTARAIRCWIDDKPIVDVDYAGRQVGTRIEVRASQPLGFASYETSGAVRNIRVRPLTPAEAAEAKKADE